MNYGLYVSASGVLTNLYRQDVISNHLANTNTTAFKAYWPAVSNRQPEAIEDPGQFGLSQRLLDRLGGGVLAGPQAVTFDQASLESTGRPLDAALTREDQFFRVQAVEPNTNRTRDYLTRDGRFVINDAGALVTVTGHRVLDGQGDPIQLPPGATASLDSRGRLLDDQTQADLAQLAVVRVANPGDRLDKAGQGLFKFRPGASRQIDDPDTIALKPGFVEASNVNQVRSLMRLISTSKQAMGNARMIQYHDHMMEQAVNTLGRVA